MEKSGWAFQWMQGRDETRRVIGQMDKAEVTVFGKWVQQVHRNG